MINKLINLFFIQYYKVQVGKNFRCDGRIIFQGHGFYQIGNDVHIISSEMINPVGGGKTVLQTFDNAKIIIGNHVGISHSILCARNSITIEDYVMLGGGVKIYDNDFHSLCFQERIEHPDIHIKALPIVIKEGAFIGAHAIILKGVTIGKHSIIGAGSVVTKNIPDYEIWAGNPACFVRKVHENEEFNR